MNLTTEQELIELLKNKKEKYYRIAFTYVKNRDDALDIVHNAVVKALQKIHTLKNREYLETWFYRILINESVTFIRKNKNILFFDELSNFNPTVEQIDEEQHITLYSAIDKLSPKLKTVIIFRFFEELKLEEIAEITATNLSTVKARLYKALKLLKIELEDVDYDR